MPGFIFLKDLSDAFDERWIQPATALTDERDGLQLQ